MTKELCERLGLPQRRNYMQIPSIDSTRTTALIETHHAIIWSRFNDQDQARIFDTTKDNLPKINKRHLQPTQTVGWFILPYTRTHRSASWKHYILRAPLRWSDQVGKKSISGTKNQIRMDYPGPLMDQRTCRLPSPVCHPIVATLRISWNVSGRYRKALFVQDELKVMKNAKTSLCGHIVATKTDILKCDSLYVIA